MNMPTGRPHIHFSPHKPNSMDKKNGFELALQKELRSITRQIAACDAYITSKVDIAIGTLQTMLYKSARGRQFDAKDPRWRGFVLSKRKTILNRFKRLNRKGFVMVINRRKRLSAITGTEKELEVFLREEQSRALHLRQAFYDQYLLYSSVITDNAELVNIIDSQLDLLRFMGQNLDPLTVSAPLGLDRKEFFIKTAVQSWDLPKISACGPERYEALHRFLVGRFIDKEGKMLQSTKKSQIVYILLHLHELKYLKEKPTNAQIAQICKDTFGINVSYDYVKKISCEMRVPYPLPGLPEQFIDD
jgi:hypothetical protein